MLYSDNGFSNSCSNQFELPEHEMQLLFENMISPFSYYRMLYNVEGEPIDYIFLAVNSAFEQETGLRREQVIGKRVLEIYPETETYWFKQLGKVARSGVPIRIRNYSSALDQWYDVIAYSPQRDHFAMTVTNITDSIRKEEQLLQKSSEIEQKQKEIYHLAYQNPVTKLPNKNVFMEYAGEMIEQADTTREKFALILFDLDNFCEINTSFGSAMGDQLLFAMGQRLLELATNDCTLYSFNGDEFVFLIRHASSKRDIDPLVKSIIARVKEPLWMGDTYFYLTASCGIAMYPKHGHTLDDLIMNVRFAMYKAKKSQRGSFTYYDKTMGQALVRKMHMQSYLQKALDLQEFYLCYQPLADPVTRQITGFEALLRWDSPELGIVPPLSFIGSAEENRLILPIGEWVLETACSYLEQLNRQLQTRYTLAVNISVVQLMQPNFIDRLLYILEKTGFPYELLELEITETYFLNATHRTIVKLERLNTLGIRVSLDDFGTGVSSLSSLKDLTISTIKIDKSFINSIQTSDRNRSLTNAIIRMGHALGLQIVAEGVETAEQLELLRSLKCDRIQGYWISRPLTAQDMNAFLTAYQDAILS